MSDIFYVKNRAGQLIQATFLSYNGSYVNDPNKSTAQNAPIYDVAGNQISNANPNGYLIVPANYRIADSLAFANQVAGGLANTANDQGATLGLSMMVAAFVPNGSQDLQRTYPGSTGVNPDDFVSAFTSAASFNFGLISTASGVGETTALQGGGALNLFNSLFNSRINTSGLDGNNPANVLSIDAGSNLATQIGASQPANSTTDIAASIASLSDQLSQTSAALAIAVAATSSNPSESALIKAAGQLTINAMTQSIQAMASFGSTPSAASTTSIIPPQISVPAPLIAPAL
ncbi:hypothetical protein LGM43_23870 [Burkholderia seminalis]|uniref:hypothetical protein n=1 Tax=Burkholderia seminalis TaxID=488731 RepID=UPI001CF140DA|nr:hypothetical protein [Burkholderia seminalis]MCA7953310.1 hypothetical protein [Burkholderia seminalis]